MGSSNNSKLFYLPTGLVLLIAIAVSLYLSNPEEIVLKDDEAISIDGIAFPRQLKIAGSKQVFIGGGTRVKWMVKVYGVGIYSEPKLIKSLKSYAGVSGEALMNSSDFTNDFAESKLTKSLLMRFHREVGASDISEALGEALKPRIGEKISDTFQKFILDMISKDRLEKGSDIFITCKGEKLWASLDGEKGAASISINGLCPAVFLVYLGDTPVSTQAKEGFANGFAELVAK
ncbi:hypothetical protein ACHAXS_010049 [Conticribra weissflogii]